MQNLDEIVDEYLRRETDFALMITGKWGVGKTYYYNTVLEPKISKTPTYVNNSKTYKPVFISLFGIKSIEDIQTEIFLALVPLLKNKVIKLTGNIGHALIKGIMRLHQLGEMDDYISEIKKSKKDWINFSELVLCFDDLERLSKEFNLEELIGYINSLVEKENVKILIIANEDKIEDPKFFTLKEKVIGNSIEFNMDINNSYDSLIGTKFKGSPTYYKFLKEKKTVVLDFFRMGTTNLRILNFCLTYFQTIFSEISTLPNKEKALKEMQNEILENLLKFTISISIEYREGNKISFAKRENLDIKWGSSYDLLKAMAPENKVYSAHKKKVKKEFREIFLEKYYTNYGYVFYNSVYDYITGGSVFKINDLVQQLKAFYNIVDNKILPQYEILNSLNFQQWSLLSEKEYRERTKKMLKYSDNGDYDIGAYLNVFYLASRFNNPFHSNLHNLEKRIIKGMKRGKSRYKYVPMLDSYLMIDNNSRTHEFNLRIKEAALKINEHLRKDNEVSDYKKLEELFYSELGMFISKVSNYSNKFEINDKYLYEPVFKYFSPRKFYSFFLKVNNSTRLEIILFFEKRYGRVPDANLLKPEIEFFEKLKARIENRISSMPKSGPTNHTFSRFGLLLEKILRKLNKTE